MVLLLHCFLVLLVALHDLGALWAFGRPAVVEAPFKYDAGPNGCILMFMQKTSEFFFGPLRRGGARWHADHLRAMICISHQ